MTLETLFNTLGKTKNGRIANMGNAEWKELPEDMWMEQWQFSKGSLVKVFETKNFGWIVFHASAKLTNGAEPVRRIFKW